MDQRCGLGGGLYGASAIVGNSATVPGPFFDKQRNVLVYVAYSDRVIEGSPKNSISSVPIMSWPVQ